MTSALLAAELPVRAFVHAGSVPGPHIAGAEMFEGDLFDRNSLRCAMQGVRSVFHIAPPHHSGEFALGQMVIDAAGTAQVGHFVYLSAIHSMLEALPAHRMKRMVEEYLIDSSLPYTILQPTFVMQNLDLARVLATGILPVPYSVTMRCRSLIDRTWRKSL